MNNALFVVNFNNQILANSRDSFKDAALRWECEYVEITERDFSAPYPPQFVKLKAFELSQADRVFCIDADTVIRADTPNPFDFSEGILYACLNKQSHMGIYIGFGETIEKSEFQKIHDAGFGQIDFNFDNFFNSGMWIGDAKTHQDTMERALQVGLGTGTLGWWDQAALNYAVAEQKVELQLLDNTWNWCLPNFGQWAKMERYIYHFAGMPDRYSIIPQIDWRAT